MNKSIRISNLNFIYQHHPVVSIDELEIPMGSRTAIIGPNGAGKSTLLKCLVASNRQDGSVIQWGNKSLFHQLDQIAYVPQKISVNWQFPARVIDVVKMGIPIKKWTYRRLTSTQLNLITHAMDLMELTDLRDRPINQLSGGQKQRVFIARAIAQNAKLYLLDEPLTGVDAKSEQVIMDYVKNIQQQGCTSITVHHDLTTVRQYFDYVVLLNHSVIAAGPTDQVFNHHNIDRTYKTSIFEQWLGGK